MFFAVVGAGCGTSAVRPVGLCSITTTIKIMINTSRTSINGVTFIWGEEGPPPAENAIGFLLVLARAARACLEWIGHPRGSAGSTPDGISPCYFSARCCGPRNLRIEAARWRIQTQKYGERF